VRCEAPAGGRTCSCVPGRYRRRILLPEAGASSAAALIDVVSLRFPSGRSAEEVVPRRGGARGMANLACLELHPHPVRADDLDHPDELA
jgi:DNA primase